MNDLRAKAERQQLIRKIISSGDPRTQREIVEALASSGLNVTQATVSRDLDEIGVVRERSGGYRLKSQGVLRGPGKAVRRLVAGSVVEVAVSGDMVVVKTLSGHAQFVASVLDDAELENVVGTIGGDDTILVVASPKKGKSVGEAIRALSGLGDEVG